MKKVFCQFARFSAIVALLTMAGCATTAGPGTVSISSNRYSGGRQYPQSDPAQVQLLRAGPTRPHVRLGEVTARPSGKSVSGEQIEDALRQAASEMGADAVVIVFDRTQATGAVATGNWYGQAVQPTADRVIVGVAIKYQ